MSASSASIGATIDALALASVRTNYAARMFAMKRSSSWRKRALSLESVFAEFNTSPEATPVSLAPRLTCMMLAAAWCVPLATL